MGRSEGSPGKGLLCGGGEALCRAGWLRYLSRQGAPEQEEEKQLPCDCQAPRLHTASRGTTSPRACRGGRGQSRQMRGTPVCLSCFNPSILPARAACQAASVAGRTVPSLSAGRDPLLAAGRGFIRQPHGKEGHRPMPARCPRCGCRGRAGSDAPAAPQLCAPSHVCRSQQAGSTPLLLQNHGLECFLEAFQAASLQAALCAPSAPG